LKRTCVEEAGDTRPASSLGVNDCVVPVHRAEPIAVRPTAAITTTAAESASHVNQVMVSRTFCVMVYQMSAAAPDRDQTAPRGPVVAW
jgi:hypothetical protein